MWPNQYEDEMMNMEIMRSVFIMYRVPISKNKAMITE
jgi:hypothetical protein